jgi:hypothetical protein
MVLTWIQKYICCYYCCRDKEDEGVTKFRLVDIEETNLINSNLTINQLANNSSSIRSRSISANSDDLLQNFRVLRSNIPADGSISPATVAATQSLLSGLSPVKLIELAAHLGGAGDFLARALIFCCLSADSLAWKALPGRAVPQNSQRFYYFNCLSAETIWKKPGNYVQLLAGDERILASRQFLHRATELCRNYGVALGFWRAEYQDKNYPGIAGEAPALFPALYYEGILLSELGIYPIPFIRDYLGLKEIILVRNLHYCGQKRMAVPNHHSRILYLDVQIEDIYYLQDVFHHELFHIIDYLLCKHLFLSEEQKSTVNINNIPDDRWAALNPAGFQYGAGGWAARSSHMILEGSASSQSLPCGFLNYYCLSAAEEDKAETYAGMIRMSHLLFDWRDAIVQKKAWEIRERLQLYCPALDERWWDNVVNYHLPWERSREHAEKWKEMKAENGCSYWFNPGNQQTTWITPSWVTKPRRSEQTQAKVNSVARQALRPV